MSTPQEPRKFPERDVISHLEIIDVQSGKVDRLHTFDRCMEAPNWTKDGKALIYNAGGRIWRYDLATGGYAPIDTGFATYCNNDHVLSPDGARLAVSHHAPEDYASRIYTLPLAGGTPVQVTPAGPSYLHGWSPDGGTLAYCAERGGEYDIYTIPVDGGDETRLTDAPGLSDGPEYSPDGQHIWFNSVRSGLMQVWRMRADGSEQTQMTDDDRNNWFPHVSPDGRQVVYISYLASEVAPGDHPANKNVELRLMPEQGGTPQTLLALLGGQGTINVNSWAPDSSRLAYVRYEIKGE